MSARWFLACGFALLLVFSPLCHNVSVVGADQSNVRTLREASTEGLIDVVIRGAAPVQLNMSDLSSGNGSFYGQCIQFEVTSLITANITLVLETGTILTRDSIVDPSMITTSPRQFELKPGESFAFGSNATIIGMSGVAPYSSSRLYLEDAHNQTLLHRMAQKISEAGQQNVAGQCAVWALMDNATADSLGKRNASAAEIMSANILYSSVTGRNIPGLDQASDRGPMVIVIALAALVVIVLSVVYVKRKGSRVQNNYQAISPSEVEGAQSIPLVNIGVPPPPQVTSTISVICPNCTEPVETGATFCPNCGAEI